MNIQNPFEIEVETITENSELAKMAFRENVAYAVKVTGDQKEQATTKFALPRVRQKVETYGLTVTSDKEFKLLITFGNTRIPLTPKTQKFTELINLKDMVGKTPKIVLVTDPSVKRIYFSAQRVRERRTEAVLK